MSPPFARRSFIKSAAAAAAATSLPSWFLAESAPAEAATLSAITVFLNSPMIYWLTTFVGVIVFTALTAYDTQKLKQFALVSGPEQQSKVALQGALMLYLDFINLFVLLLRIFGSRDE